MGVVEFEEKWTVWCEINTRLHAGAGDPVAIREAGGSWARVDNFNDVVGDIVVRVHMGRDDIRNRLW